LAHRIQDKISNEKDNPTDKKCLPRNEETARAVMPLDGHSKALHLLGYFYQLAIVFALRFIRPL